MNKKQEENLNETLTTAHADHAKGLSVHAFYKIRDRTTGQDLVQDTFMKTWIYLVRGGKIKMMRAFLYHVLNNLIVDEYRKQKTTSLDALLEKGFEPSTGDAKRLFNVLDGKSAQQLLDRLPEKYRTVMHMRYVQELTLSEIALLTHQSKNTIAVQIHRGLKKLKKLHNAT